LDTGRGRALSATRHDCYVDRLRQATYQIRQREAEYALSQVFIAFDITQSAGAAWIEQEVDNIIADLQQAEPEAPAVEVMFPGERVLRTRQENLTTESRSTRQFGKQL